MNEIGVYMFVYLFPPEYTGASIQALNLAKALRGNGVKVTFVTATTTCDSHIKTHYDGFRVIRLWLPVSKGNLSLLIYWLKVFYILLRDYSKYSVIHSHGLFIQNNILSLFGKLLGKKTLVKTTLSNEVEGLGCKTTAGLENKFNYYTLSRFDHIIALSNVIKEKLVGAGITKETILHIPNGVDLSRFHPVRDNYEKLELRRQFDLPDGTLFSYIGVVHKRKNIDWLIKEWLRFFQGKDDVYLLIAGPGPRENLMSEGGGGQNYVDEVNELVVELNGEDKVIFLPFIKEVEDYFKLSDFFLNPSESEGLSNSMLEAMACGVVPIVSRTSGAEDVIADGKNGHLFDVGDHDSFKEVLSEVEGSMYDKNVVSARAINEIRMCFSIDAIARKYIQAYEA